MGNFKNQKDYEKTLKFTNTLLDQSADQPQQIPKRKKVVKQPTFQPEQISFTRNIQNKPIQSLLQNINKFRKTEFSTALAKNVLRDNSQLEYLSVSNPTQVEGFTTKIWSKDARSIFKRQLQQTINQRKTQHLDPSLYFQKSSSNFTGAPIQSESSQYSNLELFQSVSSNKLSDQIYFEVSKQKFLDVQAEDSDEEEREESDQREEIDQELIDIGRVQERKKEVLRKHMADMMAQDQIDLMKVANGQFKRKNLQLGDEISTKKSIKINSCLEVSTGDQLRRKLDFQAPEISESDEQTTINMRRFAFLQQKYKRENPVQVSEDQKYLSLIQKPKKNITRFMSFINKK